MLSHVVDSDWDSACMLPARSPARAIRESPKPKCYLIIRRQLSAPGTPSFMLRLSAPLQLRLGSMKLFCGGRRLCIALCRHDSTTVVHPGFRDWVGSKPAHCCLIDCHQ
jgi:hypothetical protein